MQYERRKHSRIKVYLKARWEGVSGVRSEANVTSLSFGGCFLLSGGKVEAGELLRIEIFLPDEEPLYAWGSVANHDDEIGFGVQFTLLEPDDEKRLAAFCILMSATSSE